ncbi:glycosyltransferase [Thermococcus sp. MAR1]|uniref:glycosyltransferase n=1 Tax=Thermococcus sp. MAR1 TaxID=1638263 RepID=UPI00143C9FE2|nr:glycosyltransferase [Thermococcus sp. MAR1]NJE11147.1 glycosyltransferase family 4 protein [Thermococcus sp. MAR1]
MKVLMIGPIEKAGGVSTHTKELTRALRKLGVNVEVYNISPDKEYSLPISALIKLYKRTLGLSFKLLKDSKKFDVIHIQSSGPIGGFLPAIVGALWKKLLGFKLIVTFHYRPDKRFIQKWRWVFNFVLSNSDRLFVVSQQQRDNIKHIFEDENVRKVLVIQNGFNSSLFNPVDKFEARKILGLPSDKRVILNVANLVPVKGHEFLIRAFSKVVKERKDVLLIIVGDGSERKKLERLISELGLENYIKLVGSKPHDEIPLWMNAADIFVLPSLSEGNPTVMFEALGVGLPFVGTAVGGVPEIITSGDYGLLCPPADPECLGEKILIALDKEWDREKIREYAEQFTWEEIAEKILGVYYEVFKN